MEKAPFSFLLPSHEGQPFCSFLSVAFGNGDDTNFVTIKLKHKTSGICVFSLKQTASAIR